MERFRTASGVRFRLPSSQPGERTRRKKKKKKKKTNNCFFPGPAERALLKLWRALQWRARTAPVRLQCGPGSAPDRLRFGSGSAPVRLRIGSGSAPDRLRFHAEATRPAGHDSGAGSHAIERPIESPTATPIEKSVESPIGSPIERPVESPIATPIEKPVESPIGSPAECPIEKHWERVCGSGRQAAPRNFFF